MEKSSKNVKLKRRVFDVIQIGNKTDFAPVPGECQL